MPDTPPNRPDRGQRLLIRVFAVFVLAIAGLSVGMLAMPHLRRWQCLRRLGDPAADVRLVALNELAGLAVRDDQAAEPLLQALFSQADAADPVIRDRVDAIAVWSLHRSSAVRSLARARLPEVNDDRFVTLAGWLRQAGWWRPSFLPVDGLVRFERLRLASDRPAVRRAALQALEALGPPAGALIESILSRLPADSSPEVRCQLVWTAAACLDAETAVGGVLTPLRLDLEAGVRRAAEDALAVLGPPSPSAPEVQPAVDSEALLRDLEMAIQAGDGFQAAKTVAALGGVADVRFVPLLRGIVDELHDLPIVQYEAARAVQKVDVQAGIEAFRGLCASPTAEIRALAAFQLGQLPNAPPQELAIDLREGGDPLRGGAALGLAFGGHCMLAQGETLAEELAPRLDIQSSLFESAWHLRADYLCAQLMCGHESAREELDVFLLNEHVSRTALYAALLHSGSTDPLELLLCDTPRIDPESFLTDARFAGILARYVPDAPRVGWQETAAPRRRQTERLRNWWRVFRHRLAFDPVTRTFRVELTRR